MIDFNALLLELENSDIAAVSFEGPLKPEFFCWRIPQVGRVPSKTNNLFWFLQTDCCNVWIFQIYKDKIKVNHIGPLPKRPIYVFLPAAAFLCWGWLNWPIWKIHDPWVITSHSFSNAVQLLLNNLTSYFDYFLFV